jgi:hypothetical protein
MNTILYERHLFEREPSTAGGRIVKVLLHIDHSLQRLAIGEEFDAFQHIQMSNERRDILAGPFDGEVAAVSTFVDVYREALEFGKKRLDEVREALPQL